MKSWSLSLPCGPSNEETDQLLKDAQIKAKWVSFGIIATTAHNATTYYCKKDTSAAGLAKRLLRTTHSNNFCTYTETWKRATHAQPTNNMTTWFYQGLPRAFKKRKWFIVSYGQ